MGPKKIDGVAENLSGITFSRDSKTLFAVLNAPTIVLELDTKGTVKRIIGLKFFDDTEGITWIRKNEFGVVEERKRNYVGITIDADTTEVDYSLCKPQLIESKNYGNKGLEGVTYDSKNDRYFVVKEKKPRKTKAKRK